MNRKLDGDGKDGVQRRADALLVCAFPRNAKHAGITYNRGWMVAEFEELARSAGFMPIETIVINYGRISPAIWIGKGQLDRIKEKAAELEPEFVLVNLNLSPVHQRNWQQELDLTVFTRPDVIFDIFERNAHTAEGKLQVELARRRYDLPRIMQIFEEQSGTRGGIGVRGLGEKLHLKTRGEIRERIHKLQKRLDKIGRDRKLRSSLRERSPIPIVALVGYTNAGKSSLLNVLTGSAALVDDRYFATLNPTVRRLTMPGGMQVLVSDTVGFIEDLPRELTAAFQATLEELDLAGLIVHVVDLSRPDAENTVDAALEILDGLGLGDIPRITILNKLDAISDPDMLALFLEKLSPAVAVSCLRKTNIMTALELIENSVRRAVAVKA